MAKKKDRKKPREARPNAPESAPVATPPREAEPDTDRRDAAAAPREAEPAPRDPASGARARREPMSWTWIAGAVILVVVAVVAIRVVREEPVDEEVRELGGSGSSQHAPERFGVRVVRSFPHDPRAFTQGLLWHDGSLYESTGLEGRSSLRRVDLESGEVRQRRDVDDEIFAEGLARVGDRLIQLTWTEGIAFQYRLSDFEPIGRFSYDGEGWGLCHDGDHLVMSDGSDRLFFRDPDTFEVVRSVTVRDRGEPVDMLNELECVGGAVWANVWQTDRILRIDPRNGRVTGIVDASDLLSEEEALEADVLNGIAWIPEREHFVITGKLWPHLYEIELVPR